MQIAFTLVKRYHMKKAIFIVSNVQALSMSSLNLNMCVNGTFGSRLQSIIPLFAIFICLHFQESTIYYCVKRCARIIWYN